MTASELEEVSFLAKIDDPQDLSPVVNAFCLLVEAHISFETKAVVAVFRCWRSQQAYLSGKNAFEAIRVELAPDKGGNEFFSTHTEDLKIGPSLFRYLIKKGLLPKLEK
jgi:hypothetical protein